MVISKETLQKIKDVIDNHYNKLTISVLGKSVFTSKELRQLKSEGIDTNNPESFLELVYNYNFINDQKDAGRPTSASDTRLQQAQVGVKPVGEAHDAAVEHLNEMAKVSLDKLKTDSASQIEGLIRDANNGYRMNALQNLDRSEDLDRLVKESSLGKIKQKLRDYTKNGNRNWERIASTEVSNAIGLGSTDRIVSMNKDKKPDDIYVYRIVVDDAALCKWCRSFYQDDDGSPKVYKLSSLLNNGSNYGKKTSEWRPVIAATHPNERCGQVIELKPGWEVQPGGSVKFVGKEAWDEYILNKLVH